MPSTTRGFTKQTRHQSSFAENLQFYRRLGLARLIIADGMQRSGSTLLFNMVRLILLSDERSKLTSGWIKDFATLPPGNVFLLKCHGVDAWKIRRAALLFYTYRDIRDALVSKFRKFNQAPSIEMVRKWVVQFDTARKHADLMIRYEDMVGDVHGTVEKVAKSLRISVPTETITRELPSSFEDDNSGDRYSKTTLLHKDHITGTHSGEWRQVLDKDLQRQIDAEFGWWFSENGYEKL